MKLIVFDLDGTLACLGRGIKDENLTLLKKLENEGNLIAICSGKPCYYLCGFMRQVGLKNAILIGENGANIVFGVNLPPKRRYLLPVTKQAVQNLKKLKTLISNSLNNNIWFQPNEVCLTPFPIGEKDFDTIESIILQNPNVLKGLEYYRHSDCFDFVPKGLNKYKGVEFLANILNIPRKDVIAVGDGINDFPMFDFAGYSVGINIKDKKVDRNFNDIKDGLLHLLELTK